MAWFISAGRAPRSRAMASAGLPPWRGCGWRGRGNEVPRLLGGQQDARPVGKARPEESSRATRQARYQAEHRARRIGRRGGERRHLLFRHVLEAEHGVRQHSRRPDSSCRSALPDRAATLDLQRLGRLDEQRGGVTARWSCSMRFRLARGDAEPRGEACWVRPRSLRSAGRSGRGEAAPWITAFTKFTGEPVKNQHVLAALHARSGMIFGDAM